MAAGIISLLLLLLQPLFNLKPAYRIALLLLGLLFACVLFRRHAIFAAQAFSLLAALLFPLYCALLLLFSVFKISALKKSKGTPPRSPARGKKAGACPPGEAVSPAQKALPGPGGPILLSLARVLTVFLFSLAGGLLLHGLLTLPPFFHGMELFRGVKLMYSLPLGLAALAACTILAFMKSGGPDAGTAEAGKIPGDPVPAGICGFFSLFHLELPPERKNAIFGFLRRLPKRPVTLGDLALLAALLAAAYLYLTRTGHVLEISSAEDSLRGGLEHLFGVRPRFKEFALGYPLAILGLYLLGKPAAGQRICRIPAFAFLAAGTLAPISVVNTFAHITAPAGLSLLRSFHGFWLGCFGGLILILIWEGVTLFFFLQKHHRDKGKNEP